MLSTLIKRVLLCLLIQVAVHLDVVLLLTEETLDVPLLSLASAVTAGLVSLLKALVVLVVPAIGSS